MLLGSKNDSNALLEEHLLFLLKMQGVLKHISVANFIAQLCRPITSFRWVGGCVEVEVV